MSFQFAFLLPHVQTARIFFCLIKVKISLPSHDFLLSLCWVPIQRILLVPGREGFPMDVKSILNLYYYYSEVNRTINKSQASYLRKEDNCICCVALDTPLALWLPIYMWARTAYCNRFKPHAKLSEHLSMLHLFYLIQYDYIYV